MPSLKDVKTKIEGVKKTSQITKAMNMVASAKLRGAQDKMEQFRPYTAKFNEAMGTLSGNIDSSAFPLMEKREVKTAEIVVITSDRGLCGSFNAHIIKMAEKMRDEYEAEGKKVTFTCVGKKGDRYFRKKATVRTGYDDIMGTFQIFNARTIAQDIAANFLAGEADEVKIVYGRFISVGIQKATTQNLLPVQPVEEEGGEATEAATMVDYIYEPSSTEVMDGLLPLFMNVTIYHTMLEVGASEQAARMTAMDNATNACSDIVDELTTIYNKARQAAITGDLMDIVGGAEALKG